MNTRLLCAGAGFLALNLLASPFSNLSFDAALKRATETHKIVLVDFYTTWCGPCKLLDANTWTDPDVIRLLEQKTVALRVDAEQETNLAERFQIQAYPTIVLIRTNGTELDRLLGYRDPQTFIAEFTAALKGKDAMTPAKDQFTAGGDNHLRNRMQSAGSLAQAGPNAGGFGRIFMVFWMFDPDALW